MAEENGDYQDQLRDFMEAAQRPQAPLTNTELKKVRSWLDQLEKSAWLRKRIYVMLPWITTLLVSLAAGWKYLVAFITGHS